MPIGTWGRIKEATDYLWEKLSLNPVQCCIVAQLMVDYTKEKREEDLCYYMDWESGEVLCVLEDMGRLVERGVVYPFVPFSRRSQRYYLASDALVHAVCTDGELIAPWELGHKTYEFWAGVGMAFCTLMRSEIRVDALFYALRNLIAQHRDLTCCQRLAEQALDDREQALLLLLASEYLLKDHGQVKDYECRWYIHGDVIEQLAGQLEDRSSAFCTKQLVQVTRGEECCFSLTEHARLLLFDDDRLFGVLDALSTPVAGNEEEYPSSHSTQQDMDVFAFWGSVSDLLHQRSMYEIRYGKMECELMKLVQSGQHLDCCRRLAAQHLNCFDFVFLLVLCSKYIEYEWDGQSLVMYQNVVPFQCIELIVAQCADNTSELLSKDLVRMSDDYATVSLTQHAKNLFVDPELMESYG